MNALARLIGGWKFMQNGLKIKEVKLWDPMKRSVIKHKSPWKLCSLHVAAALCHATEKDRTHRLTRERERERERDSSEPCSPTCTSSFHIEDKRTREVSIDTNSFSRCRYMDSCNVCSPVMGWGRYRLEPPPPPSRHGWKTVCRMKD